MFQLFTKLFDSNEKQLQKVQPIIDEINSLEQEYRNLSDDDLRKKTEEFRKTLGVNLETCRTDMTNLEEEKKKLAEILPQAYATVREASDRITNHRHFDVQVLAGYFLFDNKVVELFTGEGKTLAANMPLYLYALTGRGAHLVTVNDYLARRDAEWNGHILNSLGLTVGAVNSGTQYKFISDEEVLKLKGEEGKGLIEERERKAKEEGRLKYDHMSGVNLVECSKKEVYDCDVVYGTNNEFGFDYLRDNMVRDLSERVQGPLYFSIVDEADSILIDEARTPLIISTSAAPSNDMYKQFSSVVRTLSPEKHYTVDEKANAVSLTDEGVDAVERLLKVDNVYENAQLAYHLDNALKAKELYHLDDQYMIRDGEVLIVDEFTGRAMPGRRYSEGLHQAIEAKEGLEVKRESRTMATITLQNYFRLYSYFSGMTATALTEAEELSSIYNLDTLVIPTNKPVVRKDHLDVVYRTYEGKLNAIVNDIKEHNTKGQPILVGTTSVEKSEYLSEKLSKEGIKHSVLNAKNHEMEAKIVSEAGQKGTVTIATNMAGRGTDIALGEGVRELGGLYVIGSERHESRRIDNQLRGRSGRQGDPGESRFYVSFEDELMRLFGGERMKMIMEQIGGQDDIPIEMGILGKTIENAQKKVESHNYDIRKSLVEYDDVLNQQRNIIYNLRSKILQVTKKEYNKEVTSIDIKKLKEIDINKLQDELDSFSLTEDNGFDMDILHTLKYDFSPVEIWILKKVLEEVDRLISVQLTDDMKISEGEESRIFKLVENLLSEEYILRSSKELGYENFFKQFDELKDTVEKKNLLSKLILVSFGIHLNEIGFDATKDMSKVLLLQSVDRFWMEHLDNMADLREGISLRNLAQRDPLVEYKNEGFQMFDRMLLSIEDFVINRFFKVRLVRRESIQRENISHSNGNEDKRPGKVGKSVTVKNSQQKLGRNDPCHCGSGKKYKKCCYPN